MLFIVSQVELESASPDGGAISITVARAEGEKCARCWRVVPTVSALADTAGLCDRCLDALQNTGGRAAG
jgi:isoleucyl-tRNA synthetase